jgi:hypothetical protein
MNKKTIIVNDPLKKSDKELYELLTSKIFTGEYVFKKHSRQRQNDRNISDIEVLDVLEGKKGRKRHRNKEKDKYETGRSDWNYCIEGVNIDNKAIRIIISFEDGLMPIITVMWI